MIFSLFSAIISGALLFLAFPKYDISLLAWVVIAPLMMALSVRTPKQGFLLGYLCGLVFFPGIFQWTLKVPGYTYLHHALLDIYLSFYFGLFSMIFAFISRRFGIMAGFVAAPFFWTALEYARSNLSFLALPWGLLAHSQYSFIPAIQIASVAGAYGVSFLIMLVNSTMAAVTLYLLANRKAFQGYPVIPKRPLIFLVSFTALLAGSSFIYGHVVSTKEISGERIKISLVQPNIEQNKKWDKKYAKIIMDTLTGLTVESARARPALIIWPETATPTAINHDKSIFRAIKKLAVSSEAYILLGSAQVQKFVREQKQQRIFTNSAFLISPVAKETTCQKYDKIRLFPFGEYLPGKDIFPWSVLKIAETNRFSPGKDFTLFDFPRGVFAATICWENMFPNQVRQFVRHGAQFIVNITNEAWFGNTAAPYQFLSMNVFRAVENRVYVVRCANTGISCFIDPYGRVIDRVKDAQDRDVFVEGVLTGSVVPLKSSTFYTRHGDWLVWLSFIFSALLLLIAVQKKSPRPYS